MDYIILIIALVAVVWGADNLVNGAVAIARRFKISDFVIGAIIVGIGTSLPELVVSSYGAIKGNVDVAIGNVVGSNIFNVLGILGLTALLYPVAVNKENTRFEIPYCIAVSLIATLFAFNFFNGTEIVIGRVDGLIFLALFAAFIYVSFMRDRKKGTTEQTTEQAVNQNMGIATLKVVAGLIVLITGCHFFVESAVKIATAWGVNEAFISITLIACGTSLPELAASIAAAVKKNSAIALGNIVGSNIFNITFILGLSSQITPLQGGGITFVDYIVMIAAAIAPIALCRKGVISRVAGAVMLACYVGYSVYLIHTQSLL